MCLLENTFLTLSFNKILKTLYMSWNKNLGKLKVVVKVIKFSFFFLFLDLWEFSDICGSIDEMFMLQMENLYQGKLITLTGEAMSDSNQQIEHEFIPSLCFKHRDRKILLGNKSTNAQYGYQSSLNLDCLHSSIP